MSAKEDSMSERSLLILKEQDHGHRWNDVETGAFFLYSSLSRRQRVVNAICILVMKLCERLTLFGVVANLLLFCRNVLNLTRHGRRQSPSRYKVGSRYHHKII